MESLFQNRLPHKVKTLFKWKFIDIQCINQQDDDSKCTSSYSGKQTSLQLIALNPYSIATYHPEKNKKKSTHHYLPKR